MGALKGITVTLYEVTQTGTDGFGEPIYTETPVNVDNVLVAPASPEEILSTNDLYSRKVEYTLGIPKGDTHDWENRRIDFFGKSWRSFCIPIEGIEDMIPLSWHKKVMVERYE